MPSQLLGVGLALLTALSWGSGDYCGGMAARRSHFFQVLVQASCAGLALLLALALLRGASWPSRQDLAWALAAGTAGTLGLGALYRGLAVGRVAVVAPTTAVVGAMVPIAYGTFAQGLAPLQAAGFLLGLLGIGLVSRPPASSAARGRSGLDMAVAAGIGVGGFYVLIGQVDSDAILGSAVIAKAATLLLSLLLARSVRVTAFEGRTSIAVWAGLLDATGNLLYLFARSLVRLDVAAVLSSMYPAVTVLLAGVLQGESIGRGQRIGVLFCILAITLIVQ